MKLTAHWSLRANHLAMAAVEAASGKSHPWTETLFGNAKDAGNIITLMACDDEADARHFGTLGHFVYLVGDESLSVLTFTVAPGTHHDLVRAFLIEKLKIKVASHRKRWGSILLPGSDPTLIAQFEASGFHKYVPETPAVPQHPLRGHAEDRRLLTALFGGYPQGWLDSMLFHADILYAGIGGIPPGLPAFPPNGDTLLTYDVVEAASKAATAPVADATPTLTP